MKDIQVEETQKQKHDARSWACVGKDQWTQKVDDYLQRQVRAVHGDL